MARDHYIPAALLGRFSAETGRVLRERKVSVMRRNGTLYAARADAIGYSNNLYRVEHLPPKAQGFVDEAWRQYESEIPRVLSDLEGRKLTTRDWIDILVPFVAGFFARDRQYQTRLSERARAMTLEALGNGASELAEAAAKHTGHPAVANLNRIFERNVFLARTVASQLIVNETPDDLVTSDMGITFLFGDDDKPPCWGIPIGPRHFIELCLVRSDPILRRTTDFTGRTYWTHLVAFRESPYDTTSLNRSIAHAAREFVAGPRSAIERITADDIGKMQLEELDQVMNYWPYAVPQRKLAGLWVQIRELVLGERLELDPREMLDPTHGMSDGEIGGPLRLLGSTYPTGSVVYQDGDRIWLQEHVF